MKTRNILPYDSTLSPILAVPPPLYFSVSWKYPIPVRNAMSAPTTVPYQLPLPWSPVSGLQEWMAME